MDKSGTELSDGIFMTFALIIFALIGGYCRTLILRFYNKDPVNPEADSDPEELEAVNIEDRRESVPTSRVAHARINLLHQRSFDSVNHSERNLDD